MARENIKEVFVEIKSGPNLGPAFLFYLTKINKINKKIKR